MPEEKTLTLAELMKISEELYPKPLIDRSPSRIPLKPTIWKIDERARKDSPDFIDFDHWVE